MRVNLVVPTSDSDDYITGMLDQLYFWRGPRFWFGPWWPKTPFFRAEVKLRKPAATLFLDMNLTLVGAKSKQERRLFFNPV